MSTQHEKLTALIRRRMADAPPLDPHGIAEALRKITPEQIATDILRLPSAMQASLRRQFLDEPPVRVIVRRPRHPKP